MLARNNHHTHQSPDFQPSEINPADWNALFSAVEERLKQSVSDMPVALSLLDAEARAADIRSVVVDCVAALDKLHLALNMERNRNLTPADEKLQADPAAARRLTAHTGVDLK